MNIDFSVSQPYLNKKVRGVQHPSGEEPYQVLQSIKHVEDKNRE